MQHALVLYMACKSWCFKIDKTFQ